MKDKIFGVLQRVGRSFMLPIAILPVAGLFLGIGGSFTNSTMVEAYGLQGILGEGTFFYSILTVLSNCGDIVFANLPIIFAMGVAIGMAKKEKEVAALAGAIAFFIMHSAIGAMLSVTDVADSLPAGSVTSVVGIQSLQMGVFGGIIVGLGVAALHNRFYKIQLPQVLSFFGGTRFVPIISSIAYLVVGILMFYIWPVIQQGIYGVGDLVRSSGYGGTFVYGIMERALIPFGLHHVFYLPFWQTAVGGTAMVDGVLIEGAQNIFFAELASGSVNQFSVEATRFMSGKFPLMIFGLPGAALAMYRTAASEKKKAVGGLLLSAALTSMLTGITEPLEFTFLFVAPVLYVIHCIFAGAAYMLMHVFNVGVGMTFSGGLIDLTLFGIMQGNDKTNWIWVVIVGIAYFLVYYFLFSFLIRKFDFKTPGREASNEVKLYDRNDVEAKRSASSSSGELAASYSDSAAETDISPLICTGLGGKSNITDVDCCITRLRCGVADASRVDERILRETGASGVIRKGQGVQIVYGPKVTLIKSEFEDYLSRVEGEGIIDRTELLAHSEEPSQPAARMDQPAAPLDQQKKESKQTIFLSPFKGVAAPITEAPDETFAKKMMGDGVVIQPQEGVVLAPCDATVAFNFPAKHALGLVTAEDVEILIHVGMDTVKLDGEGFTELVKVGEKVKAGDRLLEFDLEFIEANAPSAATVMVFTNLSESQSLELVKAGEVGAQEPVLILREQRT